VIRTASAALLVVLLATTNLASVQTPTFRARARSVSVYATVLSTGGRVVTDLDKDDFEVLDNGVPQDVAIFAKDLQPITIVVMLDRSASMQEHFGLVRKAAEQFVGHLLPADKARIGTFSVRIDLAPAAFTSDRAELVRILNGEQQPPGPTPLWNATDTAMTALSAETGRRVVLLFTDGKDNPDNESVGFESVRRRAQSEEIMLYAIGLAKPCAPAASSFGPRAVSVLYQRGGGMGGRGLPPIGFPGRGGWPGRLPPVPGMPDGPRRTPSAEKDTGDPCVGEKPDPDLQVIADDNGGGYFELHDTDNLSATFSRVAFELHHQYLLAFTPAALDGATHSLEVRVRQPDMTVRARKSYVAAPEKEK
jgi:Ca-activated chloride channel family protein